VNVNVVNEDPQIQSMVANDGRVRKLDTPVHPSRANHSFNGIMFDIEAGIPESVEVLAFTVSAVGLVKVYASPFPWKQGAKHSFWEEVGEMVVKGRLNELTTIKLAKPVALLPKQRRGFYIHSNAAHDQGLKYQSYQSYDTVVVKDKSVCVYPGQARCGQEPFEEADQYRGWSWWRSVRGFSGTITYRAIKKVWSPKTHKEFPPAFRRTVVVLFMLNDRPDCIFHLLPPEALFHILETLEWDWFGSEYGDSVTMEDDVVAELGSSDDDYGEW